MSALTLKFLGSPIVQLDEVDVELKARKALALLAYLAVTGQNHGRDELVEFLFPERDRERARAGFRNALSIVRTAIGSRWLGTDRTSAWLVAGQDLRIDVQEFRRLAGRGHSALRAGDAGGALADLSAADGMIRGDFLEGFSLKDSPAFDDWQQSEQESLRSDRMYLVAQIANLREERGEYAEAFACARRWLSLDPLDEGAHRALMRLHALSGRRAEALRQYGRCRSLLQKDLGEAPEEETRKLHDDIASGCCTPVTTHRRELSSAVGHHRTSAARRTRSRPKESPAAPDLPPGDRAFLVLLIPNPSRAETVDATFRLAISEGMGRFLGVQGSFLSAIFPTVKEAASAVLRLQAGLRTAASVVLLTGRTGPRPQVLPDEVRQQARVLLSAAHPGQILCEKRMADLLRGRLPTGATLLFLGTHRLKDLRPPRPVHQLCHPDLPHQFPPLRTLDSRPNNLLTQPTPLIGRDEEINAITAALGGESTTMLTLTGPGGIGKTKLALHAAAWVVDQFADGVFFVDLAALREADQVLPAIAAAVSIAENTGSGRSLPQIMSDALRGKQMLLLLDNFEHLIPAAPRVADLLAACPLLKVLATSREALHLRAEQEFAVCALGLPDAEMPADAASQCAAVRLFVDRAAAVRHGFSLSDEDVTVVGDICRRLDGLPLAIELAAAKAGLVPLAGIRDGLEHRLTLLKGGARDLPARQRTLRAEIGWSHALLDDREKLLFRRLSVFAGGCTLEGAERICRFHGGPTGDEVHDGLLSLANKNLVTISTKDGELRYSFLQTIREYAVERLEESGESEDVRGRFVEACRVMAERAEPALFGLDQQRWFERLDGEYPNLLEALAWSADLGMAEEGLRLAGALGWYWFRRARFSEGKRWLERALATGPACQPALRAKAVHQAGWMELWMGRDFLGTPESWERFRESLRLNGATGDWRGIALAKAWLLFELENKAPGEISRAVEECVATARDSSDPWTVSWCLMSAHSMLQRIRAEPERTRSAIDEALILARQAGDPFLLCAVLRSMGDHHTTYGDYPSAASWHGKSLAVAREIDDPWSILGSQLNLAGATFWLGRIAEAKTLYRDCLRMAVDHGAVGFYNYIFGGLSWVARREGRWRQAVRLHAYIASGYHKDIDPKLVAWVNDNLGPLGLDVAAQEAERSIGSSLTLEQAVACALRDDEPGPGAPAP